MTMRPVALLFTILFALAASSVGADPADSARAAEDTPHADPLALLLAQGTSYGGGAGPRQRDCGRACETLQVNCQRGCFALPERDAQDACSRKCLASYEECVSECDSRSASLAAPDACAPMYAAEQDIALPSR